MHSFGVLAVRGVVADMSVGENQPIGLRLLGLPLIPLVAGAVCLAIAVRLRQKARQRQTGPWPPTSHRLSVECGRQDSNL